MISLKLKEHALKVAKKLEELGVDEKDITLCDMEDDNVVRIFVRENENMIDVWENEDEFELAISKLVEILDEEMSSRRYIYNGQSIDEMIGLIDKTFLYSTYKEVQHYWNKRRSLHITHTDLDGVACAVLTKRVSPASDVDIILRDYEDINSDETVALMMQYAGIFITDLSISEEVYDKLTEAGVSVGIYDHHLTSEWIKTKPNCIHDINRSGTKIYYDKLKELGTDLDPAMEKFVHLVDTYDRWVLTDPDRKMSEDLNRLFSALKDFSTDDGMDKNRRFIADMAAKLLKEETFAFNEEELRAIGVEIQKEEDALSEARDDMQVRTDDKGNVFLIWPSRFTPFTSIIATKLLAEKEDAVYAIIHSVKPKMSSLSIRSKEDFNVTDFYGIGGHKNAGGGSFPTEQVEQFISSYMQLNTKEKDCAFSLIGA